MNRVLIISALADPCDFIGDEFASSPDCTVVSLSAELSERLASAGISHRCIRDYAASRGWNEMHSRIGDVLAGLPVPDNVLLDDWSHLIVDELREMFFWAEVAKAIVTREHPRDLRVQELPAQHPSAGELGWLRSAFDHLAVPWQPWTFRQIP